MTEPIEKVYEDIEEALAKLTVLRDSVCALGSQMRSIETQGGILKGVVDELREENARLRKQLSGNNGD